MEIKVRGKILKINDKLVEKMSERYMDINESSCEHYIELAYATKTDLGYVPADLDVIFATKTETELSDTVNQMITKELKNT